MSKQILIPIGIMDILSTVMRSMHWLNDREYTVTLMLSLSALNIVVVVKEDAYT